MIKLEIALLGKKRDNERDWWRKYTDNEGHFTEEGEKIYTILETPAFICPECGRLVSYVDLEVWRSDTVENIVNDEVICSECYEEEMGEDL